MQYLWTHLASAYQVMNTSSNAAATSLGKVLTGVPASLLDNELASCLQSAVSNSRQLEAPSCKLPNSTSVVVPVKPCVSRYESVRASIGGDGLPLMQPK
jgi:hypothetical protein